MKISGVETNFPRIGNAKTVKVVNRRFVEDFAEGGENQEKSLETDEDRTESKLQKFMKSERANVK